MLTLGFLLIIIKQESFSPIPLKLRTKCNLTDSYLCSCFALSLLLVLLKSLSKVSATSKCFYTYHWWLFIIPTKYPGAVLLASQGKYRVTNKKKKQKQHSKTNQFLLTSSLLGFPFFVHLPEDWLYLSQRGDVLWAEQMWAGWAGTRYMQLLLTGWSQHPACSLSGDVPLWDCLLHLTQ